ncbi:MAG: Crp/Fnr family transcriptional regulator [Flavobacteriales bacterium]|nr:Crp/Fnr family transcriptional regulator [Flavobacteriales bacterium]
MDRKSYLGASRMQKRKSISDLELVAVREAMAAAGPLEEDEWLMFRSLLKEVSFQKKEHLIREGQVDNYLSFLFNGICRDYVIKDGKEFTLGFHFPGEFVGSYASFVTGTASRIYVQALTPVIIVRMRDSELNELYRISHNGEHIGRFFAEQLYVLKENREIELLTLSAFERYEKLMEEQPGLFLQIPQKLLAEYLGMTPENFSRMKRRSAEQTG